MEEHLQIRTWVLLETMVMSNECAHHGGELHAGQTNLSPNSKPEIQTEMDQWSLKKYK